jgi:hypothetical protein
MKALMSWIVAAVFVVGPCVVLAAGTDRCVDQNGIYGQKAGTSAKKSYTCNCDSPCSGSKTCPNGCYAFCEENPENSGRYVCIKGCASEAPAVKGKKLDARKKYASMTISIPREQVMALMLKLYNRRDLRPIAIKADVTEPVHIRLHHADMETLIRELER